ncbi:MAG: ATP-binding protein [Myxococcota bacterium]|nr:ATP-binding protein [Myxococcota bacterium]
MSEETLDIPGGGEADEAELEGLREEVARLRALVADLSERGRAERALVAAERALREHERRARLSDALTAAVSALEATEEPTGAAIFAAAADALEARGLRSILWGVDVRGDSIEVRDVRVASRGLGYLERVTGRRAVGYRSRLAPVDAYRRAVETRGPVYVSDTTAVLRQAFDASLRWAAPLVVRVTGIQRAIVAPLVRDGAVSDLFVVMDNALEPADLEAVGAFAQLMAGAAERAELLGRLERSLAELQAAQAQLVQSQKLQAVGLLVGGIAHDFNNLLTAMMAGAELLRPQLEQDPVAMEDLEVIRGAADRAAKLVSQLLAFSGTRRGPEETTTLDAKVQALAPLLTRTLGEQIRLELDLDAPDAEVRIAPSQLEQIVVNLVINARDAMPEGGPITVRTWVTEAGATLAVQDRGLGIPAEARDRIFDPFFSTKPTGKGTGLGLSVVYGLVESAGGHIAVESEAGQGATFEVTLRGADDARSGGESDRPPSEERARPLMLLLVEDDEAISAVLRRALERRGHGVRCASGLAEARAAIAEGLFDAVVSDVRLGDGIGLDLLEDVGDLPIVFCSGYLEEVALEGRDDVTVLRKPFSADELLEVIALRLHQRREDP